MISVGASLLMRTQVKDFEFVGPNFVEEQYFGTVIAFAVRKNALLASPCPINME
ncbi:hypothetical protein [Pseudomonas sp. Z4-20]|uniref:hypothetical protein n=1 Tax=Pseudomonas sp. Z4-20 TaxID=2817414 RepID=UPI003DA96BFA